MARKTIAVDFDGVIHSYTSGWKGADGCDDPPVPGALEFLVSALQDDRFDVAIYSTRAETGLGEQAIRRYLVDRVGLTLDQAHAISIDCAKPKAVVYIDDRACPFDGEFPTLDAIDRFKPWRVKT